MSLPFSLEEFLEVFRRYNEAVWPSQWALLLLAVGAVAAVAHPAPRTGRAVCGALALLWLWVGVVYHIGFFADINRAALLFAGLCIVQAALFGWVAVRRAAPRFHIRADVRGIAATLMVAYATLGYPALAAAIGHRYPELATFGLPCPTTIFTLGLMLVAEPALPRVAWIVPLLWAAIGTSAALQLGMHEDYGLTLAALVALALLLLRGRREAAAAGQPAPAR
jgi:Family of unknown function (DUF6064)